MSDDYDYDLAGLVGPELGFDFGARRRRGRRMAPQRGYAMQRAERVINAEARTIPAIPGVPATDAAMLPLGFPTVTFSSSSGTSLTTTVNPQAPFRARRLIVSLGRNGASATGLVVVASLRVGTRETIVSDGPVPADVFQPTSFDCDILLPPVSPGSLVRLAVQILAAPTGTDTVSVSAALIGSSII